jgi:hypothetical protein
MARGFNLLFVLLEMNIRTFPASGYCTVATIPVFLGIAVIALLLRLAPLLHDGVIMDPDSNRYIELAQGLSHGCGFSRWLNGSCSTAVETLRTPGYPIFLAAMPSLRTAVSIQGVLGAGVSLLIGLFVWKYWGLSAGIAAELIIALDIPSILLGATIMSDILFQALVAAGILLDLIILARGRNDGIGVVGTLTAAVLFGIAFMVRPLGIVLPFLPRFPCSYCRESGGAGLYL